MRKKRVVVTGASGHIGYHVAHQLIELGYPVLLLVRKENANIAGLKKSGAEIAFVDFHAPETYGHLLDGAEVLFHLASENTTDRRHPEDVIKNTYGLTKAVLDEAIAQKVPTIVYTSSVVVLGRSPVPHVLLDETARAGSADSPYVKGKMLADDYCNNIIRANNVDIRRIYPSWVMGSHDQKTTPPHKVIKSFLRSGQLFYFKGGISITGVQEVAKAHINAWLSGRPNEKYITAGHNITFRKFYATLADCTGKGRPFLFIPKWFMLAVSLLAKGIRWSAVPDPSYIRAVVGSYSWYNSNKAIKEIGYTIPKLRPLISKTVAALKNT